MTKLSIREAYGLLEIKPGISAEELKKAWRTQIKKHHPDRYPENERKTQTELTSRINEAYDLIERSGLGGSKNFFNTAQQTQHDNMQRNNMNLSDYWVDKSGVRYKISELSTMRLVAIRRMLDNAGNNTSEQFKNICKELDSRIATIVKDGKVKIKF